MKAIFKYTFMFASVASVLTSCSNDDFVKGQDDNEGRTIHLSVSATKEAFADAESRSSLVENTKGGLNFNWTKGDRIIVTNENGKIKGTLTLVGDGGDAKGEFTGDLTGIKGNNVTFNYYFLGTANNAVALEDLASYSHSYANPVGTDDSLDDYDIMTCSAAMTLSGIDSYKLEMGFKRRVSNAKFELRLPKTVEYPVIVTLSGDELNTELTLSYVRSDEKCVTLGKGSITVKDLVKEEEKETETYFVNDIYVTHLETTAAYDLNFSAVDAKGKVFIGKYKISRAVMQNEYFRKKNGEGETATYGGLPVEFTEVEYKYEVKYVTDDDQTVIQKYEPTSTKDIEWNVRNQGPADIAGIEKQYAPEGKEFDKWKDINTGNCPETVTLSKENSSYVFVPTWKDKATVNVTWKDGYTEDPIRTEDVKVGENEEKPIGNLFPNNPTREGYIFDGWEIDGKSVNPADVTITKGDVENGVVITARWKPAIKTPGYDHGEFNN